jgi:hypothetical protein
MFDMSKKRKWKGIKKAYHGLIVKKIRPAG